jgi:hypothetical protein
MNQTEANKEFSKIARVLRWYNSSYANDEKKRAQILQETAESLKLTKGHHRFMGDAGETFEKIINSIQFHKKNINHTPLCLSMEPCENKFVRDPVTCKAVIPALDDPTLNPESPYWTNQRPPELKISEAPFIYRRWENCPSAGPVPGSNEQGVVGGLIFVSNVHYIAFACQGASNTDGEGYTVYDGSLATEIVQWADLRKMGKIVLTVYSTSTDVQMAQVLEKKLTAYEGNNCYFVSALVLVSCMLEAFVKKGGWDVWKFVEEAARHAQTQASRKKAIERKTASRSSSYTGESGDSFTTAWDDTDEDSAASMRGMPVKP